MLFPATHLGMQLGLQVLEKWAARVRCRGHLFHTATGCQQGHDCCWQVQTPAVRTLALDEQLQSTDLLP